jgi:hypothetical protein
METHEYSIIISPTAINDIPTNAIQDNILNILTSRYTKSPPIPLECPFGPISKRDYDVLVNECIGRIYNNALTEEWLVGQRSLGLYLSQNLNEEFEATHHTNIVDVKQKRLQFLNNVLAFTAQWDHVELFILLFSKELVVQSMRFKRNILHSFVLSGTYTALSKLLHFMKDNFILDELINDTRNIFNDKPLKRLLFVKNFGKEELKKANLLIYYGAKCKHLNTRYYPLKYDDTGVKWQRLSIDWKVIRKVTFDTFLRFVEPLKCEDMREAEIDFYIKLYSLSSRYAFPYILMTIDMMHREDIFGYDCLNIEDYVIICESFHTNNYVKAAYNLSKTASALIHKSKKINPAKRSELDEDLACQICLCEFNCKEDNKDNSNDNDALIAKLICSHHFHLDCINEWNKTCPVCREKSYVKEVF